jgi:2-polyprenyl-6-methoxyphenol hydroxylase-like FAD-dependent oxidoreductase
MSAGYDVAVVGGGPVGMWLAAELHRGGVRPVVLERRAARPPYSKAFTIYPRTMEQLAMRGIIGRWLDEGTPVPSSHFALMKNRLDFSFLPTRYPYTLFLPQRRTEELLEEHLAELGVPYLRQHAVTGVRQDEAGVDLEVDTPGGPVAIRAGYAVGCDGATSAVRAATGIEFEGNPETWRSILGDVELADPPPTPAMTLNQPGGSLYVLSVGGGLWRVAVVDHATMYDPADKPVTFEDLQASALRLAGTDFGMRPSPDGWLSRVGNAARQAASYRAGRVLLAGDAAHIHYPAGGQGLNLGLQDAGNLGWKLAAEIRGEAPPGLLDSYQAERYPVGLDVIDDALAQCALIANPSREGIALRDRFNEFLGSQPSLCRELAIRLSGVAIRYPTGGLGGGSLAGQRVPDLDLDGAPAETIFGLLHPARFVLLNLGSAAAAPAGYAGRLDVVTAKLAADDPEWSGVRALLIRPDGYVAWATDTEDAPPLATWLGPALALGWGSPPSSAPHSVGHEGVRHSGESAPGEMACRRGMMTCHEEKHGGTGQPGAGGTGFGVSAGRTGHSRPLAGPGEGVRHSG